MRTRGLLMIAAVAGLALSACTSPPAPSSAPSAAASPSAAPSPSEPARDYKPGADGIGDAYFPKSGNGGYDVTAYDIKVKYDPKTDVLTGDVTISATATQDLSRFNFDLSGLTVRSITVGGVPATFARSGAELVVTPAQGIAKDAAFATHVLYDGKPKPVQNRYKELGEGGWFATADGAIALGEPDSAATWFPVNDHPLDKATYAVALTVPSGLSALSNGVLGPKTTSGGWTTWTWNESKPMASYLATVVIGKYRVTTSTHKGKPVLSAVTASMAKGAADTSMAHTLKIADYLETQLGAYPFDAYGGIVVKDDRVNYALETQSRPVYSAGFFRDGVNDSVVAHELAHQWYGDSVAVHGWADIWLNEGFATYAEWLWDAHAGRRSVQASFDAVYAGSPPEVWKTPPGLPGPTHIFDNTVYDRGAMTLHMLRKAVGDQIFFQILRGWAAEHAGGNATTADFTAYAEKVSGKQLDSLFQSWLFGKTRPAR